VRSPSILLVDDEPCSLRYMAMALEGEFGEVRTAEGGVRALLAMESSLPDLVISDLRMPEMDGFELLRLVKERWAEVPVILVTVEQDIGIVVDAVRRGATNYLAKPVSPGALRSAAARALNSRPTGHSGGDRIASEIVGSSPEILRVRHLISLAARGDANVLITGETGTGKELVARAIHRLSALSGGPFIPHNCAVSPQDLFESQFFGHRRGAFTGADRDQRGLLEEAHGGILFLDELECLSPLHQAKLLRVLDDGRIQPVGSVEYRQVSVRFLSATNRDPESMVATGALREDLYYRLRGFEIRVSPLRERRGDIAELAAHFLQGSGITLSSEALRILEGSSWPGNVRQLRSLIQSAQAVARREVIEPGHLAAVSSPESVGSCQSMDRDPGGEDSSCPSLREMEKQTLVRALEQARGHRGRAARALGIHRSTLRRKMRELGVHPPAG
jgi:DNA-binding NtrC family response regulator